jgi:hypothetical protein
MARRSHPFPYRTRKLSFSAPMVVGTRVPVRVGRCQANLRQPEMVVFLCYSDSEGQNASESRGNVYRRGTEDKTPQVNRKN